MNPETKHIWQSKTFWTNIILGIASFIPAIKDNLDDSTLGTVFAVANIVLRFITKTQVTIA